MQNVILVIHILACLAMIGLVLVQKSEGGGLGIGGGGGNSLMSGRGAAGALVRATMLFGAVFFITSLTLTSIANRSSDNRTGIERALEREAPAAPAGPIDLFDPTAPLLTDSLPAPAQPAAPPAPDAALTPGEADGSDDAEPENPQ
ncbi:preprotein translocase subunit SecG [Hyphomonas sp.]|uniref:preprotein translocase subunit SecG n=1 Tax=Hyphomonas sp. TaxID=87 RepID=UPI00391AC2C1